MKNWTIIFPVLLFGAAAYSGSYYVAPDGNDRGPGSFGEPWRTIGKAAGTLVAGDTVLIREGEYNETMHIRNSGSRQNSIIFMAYDNETVVIDGKNSSSMIVYIPESYIEINNLIFQNMNGWGVLIENGHHVKIQNCEIQNNLKSGIRVISAGCIDIINNRFKDNARNEDWGGSIWASAVDSLRVTGNHIVNTIAMSFGMLIDYSVNIIVDNNYTCNTSHSGIFATECHTVEVIDNEIVLACNGSFGECLSLQACQDFLIYNNEVHTSGDVTFGGEGIALSKGSENGQMYNNHVHDLEKVAIYVDDQTRITHDIGIFDNIVDNCNNGIAVSSEQGVVVENIFIYRNTVTRCFGIGINVSPWVKDGLRRDIQIYNNTLYMNGGGILVETSNVENISVLNNICSQNTWLQIFIKEDDAIEDVTVAYNIIDGYQAQDLSLYSGHNMTDSPGFVDVSIMDLYLTRCSPAIDAGHPDPRYNDPDGTRNDIGAHYFHQTVPVNRHQTVHPGSFFLYQNYPNPFNPRTTIRYQLPENSHVAIGVYNICGKEITTLSDDVMPAGRHSVSFDATGLSGGVYFYQLRADGYVIETKKMLLVR